MRCYLTSQRWCFSWLILVTLLRHHGAFVPFSTLPSRRSAPSLRSSSTEEPSSSTKAPPRSGFAQTLLNVALESPLWKYVLVPQARNNIVKTAESNGIPWVQCRTWLDDQTKKDRPTDKALDRKDGYYPDYYRKAFHAYETGNLSWDAALEVEIASCSVGARNFPKYGARGEDAFRGAFSSALEAAGAHIPSTGNEVILDLGCGTGMSTRRLGAEYPQVTKIIGIDLSPYFCHIGERLLELEPRSFLDGGTWVTSIEKDDRISYQVRDASKTGLPDNSVDVVNLQFVCHELPPEAARDVVDEALRVLKPRGQLWICEMDFESPAYAEQRANALLFSLIRSTEPFLDDYAESIPALLKHVQSKFDVTTVIPATGRHFALVATKKGENEERPQQIMMDERFQEDGTYKVEDTHLKTWESKEASLD